ncbi:hypothetical protein [Nostoc sp.]
MKNPYIRTGNFNYDSRRLHLSTAATEIYCPSQANLQRNRLYNPSKRQTLQGCMDYKYGFEILDDGIYQNNVKLGEVGHTDAGWWVMRIGEYQQMPCDSAMDAVWWLSMVDVLPTAEAVDCEELLDRPFEMLTSQDLELLREYEPVAESRELVTA